MGSLADMSTTYLEGGDQQNIYHESCFPIKFQPKKAAPIKPQPPKFITKSIQVPGNYQTCVQRCL